MEQPKVTPEGIKYITKAELWEYESKYLQQLNGVKGVPKLVQVNANSCDIKWIPGWDLVIALEQSKFLFEYSKARVVKRLIEIVIVAQQKGIQHCDIKLENVLLGEDGEIYLIDWGNAQDFYKKLEYDGSTPGTDECSPPELLMLPEGEKYDAEKYTVWTVAVLAWELVYNGAFILGKYLTTRKIPKDASTKAKSFISEGLRTDPRKRASLQRLLHHPWLANVQ